MKNILYIIIGLLSYCSLFSSTVFAQTNQDGPRYTVSGKDFWFGFMENFLSDGDDLFLRVYISSRVSTWAYISIPNVGWKDSLEIPANSVRTKLIPRQFAHTLGTDTYGNAVYVTANDSVNVYAMNINPNTTDGSIVLPIQTLQDDYYVLTYFEPPVPQNPPIPAWFSEMLIVATQDNTEIEITPACDTRGNIHLAGETFSIVLNQGDTYQIQAFGDLSGTRVRGVNTDKSCRGFAVFGGNVCTFVGSCWACDHLFEQMFPIESWGYKFGIVGSRNKKSDVFRVLASEDNTKVTLDGTQFNLNAGQFAEKTVTTVFDSKASYIEADKPVTVGMICRGSQCDQGTTFSDPYLLIIPPLDSLVTNDQSVTVLDLSLDNINGTDVWAHYVNIFTKTTNAPSIKVNGNTLPANAFKPIPQKPEYSWASRQFNTPGEYRITGDDGFYAYVYGFAGDDSYGYSGAATFFSPPLLYATTEAIIDASCPGAEDGQIDILIRSGMPPFKIKYNWRGDSLVTNDYNISINNVPTGVHTVTITDSLGCQSTSISLVSAPPPAEFPNYPDDSISYCTASGRRDLPFAAPTGGIWMGPGVKQTTDGGWYINLEDYQPGKSYVFKYFLLPIAADSCHAPFIIHVLDTIDLKLVEKKDVSCVGKKDGKITIAATKARAPFKVSWEHDTSLPNDAFTIDNLAAGTYTAIVTDADACEKRITVTINEPPFAISDTTINDIICDKKSLVLQPTKPGALRYQWTPGNTTQPQLTISKNGTYILKGFLSDVDNDCYFTETYNITFVASTVSDTVMECDPITLYAPLIPISGATYVWSNGTEGTSTRVTGPGEYQAVISFTDANCTVSHTVRVRREEICGTIFEIPDALISSENETGPNNIWRIYTYNVASQEVMIFNRWGQKIYEQIVPDAGGEITWNGRVNGTGSMVPEGVYTYYYNAVSTRGELVQSVGTVTVIR